MTDATVQRKLNQLMRLCNKLAEEAQYRYPHGQLFYEGEGQFHFMDGDGESCGSDRQKHIIMQSHGVCRLQCGSW